MAIKLKTERGAAACSRREVIVDPVFGQIHTGEAISRKMVAKVMRRLGLRGICPKRWRATTIIDGVYAYRGT